MIEYTEKITTKENLYIVNPGWQSQIEVRMSVLGVGGGGGGATLLCTNRTAQTKLLYALLAY